MNRIHRYVFLLIVFLGIPALIQAENYYVREGANGNGLDWENAFGQLPDVLERGSTYYLADGTYGPYTFDDPVDGEKYIYVYKATESEHGTDTGWDTTYGDGTALFTTASGFYTINIETSYLEINGKEAYGIKVTTTNCDNNFDLVFTDGVASQGGHGFGAKNITLAYCELEHCGEDQGDNVHNALYMRGELDKDDLCRFWTISHNYLHDVNITCIKTRGVTDSLIEHNTFARRHTDGKRHGELISWNDSGLNQNNIFRYNFLYDSAGTGMLVIKDDDGHQSGWKIYGNVFYTTDKERYPVSNGAICNTGPGKALLSDVEVYNNTFVNITDASRGDPDPPFSIQDETSGNVFKNNICINTDDVFGEIERSHNLWNNQDYAENDLDGSGQLWTGSTELFTDFGNHDYTLTQATEPGDSSIGSEYNTDMLDNVRGEDGNWDRGAFEYVSSTTSSSSTSTSTSTTGICPIERLFKDENPAAVESLRQYRDTKLTQSPLGLTLIYLFYIHVRELDHILLSNAELQAMFRQLVIEVLPGINASIYENRTLTLTPSQYSRMLKLLKNISAQSPPRLQTHLNFLRINLESGELFVQLGIGIQDYVEPIEK